MKIRLTNLLPEFHEFTMTLPSYNNQTNNTLVEENTLLLEDNETASYGLETTNTASSSSQQLGTISNEFLLDESVDTSQFGTEDDYSELVFIDSAVPDSQVLIDNISGATDVVVLDEREDEIVQISEHLSDYQQLDAVHIVSIGESGQLTFANTELSFDTLWQYDSVLRSWGDSLAEDADIVLYGCDVSFGKQGDFFLQQISQTTGADVLASVDKTGIDGDWQLETKFGEVEADSIFNPEIATAYQHTLDESIFGFTPGPQFEFDENNGDTGFDFSDVEGNEFVLLPEVDIDGDGEDFNYSELESGDIAELDYQNVPAEDLEILTTEEGLSFTEFKAEDLAELDLNNIPPENIKIMQNAGLDLTSYNTEAVADVELGVVETFGYVDESIFSISSLSEDNTFGELSATITANANLFNYKDESLNLEDGFSLSETQQLDFDDYKALDFAFDGDEIFNSSLYLEQNPDVAEDGINPFTHYFNSGAYAPEVRDPSTYFDTSFYFENNPDVAEDGINPLFQYFSSGAKAPEFRDPDPAFDTSFYLEDNPDVAEDGINPLLQYFLSGASEGRFANATFKGFEEKGEAWIVNSDISDDEFNNLKNVAKETGGDDGSLLFWIRLYGEAVDYALTFKIVDDTLEAASSLQELIQKSSEEGNVFVFPEDERLTEGNDGDVLTFPAEEITVPTGTPGFELGEPIGFDDNTFFPKGDGFLDDILEGKSGVPIEGEEGSYFLAIEENNEILKDVLDNSTLEGKNKAATYRYNDGGGFAKANELFDSLELYNIEELPNTEFEGRRGKLEDGRTVVVRESSKNDQPTLEIQRTTPSGRVRSRKIRFD